MEATPAPVTGGAAGQNLGAEVPQGLLGLLLGRMLRVGQGWA